MYRFGEFQLEPRRFELWRRGEPVSIEPRVFELLVYLVEHRDRLVPKQELLEEIWQGKHVSEAALSRCVSEARRALDDSETGRFIGTVHGRGYRFVGEVEEPASDATQASSLENTALTRDRLLDDPPIGQCLGHYRIVAPLGGGGMGVVFKAEHLRLEKPVALKFLPAELSTDAEAKSRFVREARAASSLDHPRICTIYDVDETPGGNLYIAMAYYDGESLKERLERSQASAGLAIEIAIGIAEGLAEAHRHGIVHRDVKPGNVMLTTDGYVKLLDFGLAKLTSEQSLTDPGRALGTTVYMSPEQLKGAEVDHRCDIWSLGVVLHEMLTGSAPFRRPSPEASMLAVVNDQPPAIEGSAGLLNPILERALAKSVEDRYRDVEELLVDLRKAQSLLLSETTPAGDSAITQRLTDPPRPSSRSLLPFVAVLVAVAAVAALLVALWRRAPPLSPQASILLEQARGYLDRGDTPANLQNAEDLLRRSLESDPENATLLGSLADLLARRYRQSPSAEAQKESRSLASRALDIDRSQLEARLALARLALVAEDYQEAEQHARRAVEIAPDDCRGYQWLGEALIVQDKDREGFEALRRGVDLPGGYIWCRVTLARLLEDQARQDEAVVEYLKILEVRPDLPNALQNLARIYTNRGSNSQALPLLQRWVAAEPTSFDANNTLGVAYYNLEFYDKAAEHYRAAHEADPEHPNPMFNLGEAYEVLRKSELSKSWYERARSAFDQRLETGANPTINRVRRALCSAKLGAFDAAFEDLEEALAATLDAVRHAYAAAQISALAGDRERLRKWVALAVESGTPGEIFQNDPAFEAYLEDEAFRRLLTFRGEPVQD